MCDVTIPAEIAQAIATFPESDERHWLVEAFLWNLLAHKAQQRADDIRRRTRVGA